jgi:hypothetical protein
MTPVYNIPNILKLRKKIVTGLTEQFHCRSHIGEEYDQLVDFLVKLIGRVDRDSVWKSLMGYAGVVITNAHINEISWRIAGNVARLRRGVVVPVWSSLIAAEWAPVQVQHVYRYLIPDRDKKKSSDRWAATLNLFVLGGYAAGHSFDKFMTEAACRFVRTELGFSRFADRPRMIDSVRKKSYPMSSSLEFTRMRFMVNLQPKLCVNGINFDQVKGSSSAKAWNRELMKKRQREGFSCPFRFPLATNPCYRCYKGLDQCEAACHKLTYKQGECSHCENDHAFMDPARSEDTCVDCLSRRNHVR